jgi:hypothetical protein
MTVEPHALFRERIDDRGSYYTVAVSPKHSSNVMGYDEKDILHQKTYLKKVWGTQSTTSGT